MGFANCSSAESVKKAVFSAVFKIFIILGSLLLGCTDVENPENVKGGIVPELLAGPVAQSISVNQNGPKVMVILSYTSRGGAVPTACELESLSGVVEVTPCACVGGTCRVGVQAQADIYGEGSFNFRLVSAKKVSSNKGSVKVRILPVTISVASGNGQEGLVRTKLSSPLVARVQNSDKVPVSGVKVSWKVLGGDGEISCTEVSDSRGRVQCDWTLGTKVGVDEISAARHVEASIFDKDVTAPARFTAVVKSGPAVQLAFSSEQYPKSQIAAGDLGPIGVYPQDVYENLTETEKGLEVTLSLEKKPAGGVLRGETIKRMPPLWRGGPFGDKDKSLGLDKVGTYSLVASSPSLKRALGNVFAVIPSKAAKLEFATQPGGTVAGVPFATQPVVVIKDAYGNTVDGGADGGASLTMSLATGTGALLGTTTVAATLGVSSWSGLSVNTFGSKILEVNKSDLTSSGGTGPLSATSKAFDNVGSPPPAPTGLAAKAGDGSVVLSWEASSGTTGYIVLRGTSATSLTKRAVSDTNSYTDAEVGNGITYFYAVQASSAKGISVYSTSIRVSPLSTPLLSSPAMSSTAGALVLSWSASTGASNYELKYSTTLGSSASSGITSCTVTSGAPLSCIVTGLTSGTVYYFSVNATNAHFGSVNSLESPGIPRTVTLSLMTPGSGQITPIFISDRALSFDLFYGTSTGSYSTTVTGAISGTVIEGLVDGTIYYFKVVAKFPNGSLSSAEQSTTPGGTPGFFAINTSSSNESSVTLEWGGSYGAGGYTVQYGTSSGVYKTGPTTTNTSATVDGLASGTTYYFMVTAYNEYGSRRADSERAVATRPPPPRLVFTTQPGGGKAGEAWTRQPVVALMSGPDIVTSYSGLIQLRGDYRRWSSKNWKCLHQGCSSLDGITQVSAINGVARFTNLFMKGAGHSRLWASSNGYNDVESLEFEIEGGKTKQFDRDSVAFNRFHIWRSDGGGANPYTCTVGAFPRITCGDRRYDYYTSYKVTNIRIIDESGNCLSDKFMVGVNEEEMKEVQGCTDNNIRGVLCLDNANVFLQVVLSSPGVPSITSRTYLDTDSRCMYR